MAALIPRLNMERKKRERLEKAGWKVGDAADFLNQSEEESAYVELKLALSSGAERGMIQVRPASVADAAILSEFGAATFRESFEAENAAEDMARYVAESFAPERQAGEIEDPAGTVLLAEHRAGSGVAELVGYAHLVSGPAPAAVRGPAPIELKRLYVARAWHGKGVAQALMDAALDASRARGAQTVWLGVWERNPRAAAFYAKYGFARVGEHTFLLGADAQTDWLMARPL